MLRLGCSPRAAVRIPHPDKLRWDVLPDEIYGRDLEYQLVTCGALLLTEEDIMLKLGAGQLSLPLPIGFIDEAGHIVRIVTADQSVPTMESNGEPIPFTTLYDRVAKYESEVLAPFATDLQQYVCEKPTSFATPGHDGGRFFERHPAGAMLVRWLGKSLFLSDISSSDVRMGDPTVHEGPACTAEEVAARVYQADETFFVLNGTTGSNRIVCSALLQPDDLVLFDRNNHKSIYQGALTLMGATPVFLEAERNGYGMIGGLPDYVLDETYIRERIARVDPLRAQQPRPFRLAVLQQNTHDGMLYNVREIVRRIGHLCEYILWDAAWLGYEHCIPMLEDYNPLTIKLDEGDPGMFVTQSVHKQLAGFSQTSQIHKKDSHIQGQDRYCPSEVFQHAFMLQASTSPNYPLFSSVAVNAKMHEGALGQRIWAETIRHVVSLRKAIHEHCRYIRPFQPETYQGAPWVSASDTILSEQLEAYSVVGDWHGFSHCDSSLYVLDPCKLSIVTKGNVDIPANVLAKYLEEHHVVPEKSDLYAMLFLFTPSVTEEKTQRLVEVLTAFEREYDANTPLIEVLPSLCHISDTYRAMGLKDLCKAIAAWYEEHAMVERLQSLFRENHFPPVAMNGQEAHYALNRQRCEMVRVRDAVGRIALEGALPYPPGIVLVNAGEIWTQEAADYLGLLDDLANAFPGFAGELQGLHRRRTSQGMETFCHVWKNI